MKVGTLLDFARPYSLRLFLIGILMLGSAITTLAIPWIAGQMVGQIVVPSESDLGRLVLLLLGTLSLVALLNLLVAWQSGKTAAQILADLRLRVYVHLQGLPLAFHERHRQGDTLALMTYEVASLSQFLTATLTSIPTLLMTVAGAIFFMFRIDAVLALVVPFLIPIFYLILKIVGRRLRGLGQSLQEAEANVVGLAEENLEILPAIKAFAREDLEARRYKSLLDRTMVLTLQESRIYAALEPLIGLTAAASAVVLVFFAGKSVQQGNLTMPELFSFLLYAALLTRPIGQMADLYGRVQTTRGTLGRLDAVFQQPVETGYSAANSLPDARGEIEFRDVSFGYFGRGVTLRDANLRIRAGEIIGLTGENGAGKSTLIALLLRYYDPDRGAIFLDGRNIDSLNVQALRQAIGLVPQRALLFNGTIRENIAFGLDGATDQQIEEAARLAQAHDFITKLPVGFDTRVGDHGVGLSGGERQRLSLARALVKNPPILILDEATSMYDLDSEAAFVAACRDALVGRTVIIITHRPASLALANRIIRIDGGAIREQGSLHSPD